MKSIFFSVAFLFITHTGFAQDPFSENVKKLIEVSGGGIENQMKLIEGQLSQFISKEKLPQAMDEVREEMNGLNGKIVEIYKKHYTEEDVNELLAFYKTPIGQKLSKQTELITPEVVKESQQLSVKINAIAMKYAQ